MTPFLLLVSVLSLLSFIVTTESGERISLVITNLLALTVFMLIVADILPPTSEVVPLISVFITSSIVQVVVQARIHVKRFKHLISVFITFSILQVGLSLVATCFVLQCYHTNPDINEMPFWMRHFVCNRLGPFLRVTHVKYQRAKEESGTKAKPGAQLRSIIYGYGARPSEPRNSGVDTSFDISCKVCLQELKAAPVYRSVSRRSSEVLSPPDMYADNLNSHRDRNLYSDQFRGRQEVFFDQYRTNCYHNDSPPDPLNRARLDSTSDPYRARSEYANQGYRGRNDSRAADQLYDRRNNSNTADQPYHGRNDFPAADQPYRGRKDSSNSSDHMPKTACGRDHHDCMSVLGGIIHRQDHLVEGIKRLTDAMEDQEQSSLAREEWVYAAHVIDRFCFYLFLSLLFTSIVVTFNMIPSYDDTSQM